MCVCVVRVVLVVLVVLVVGARARVNGLGSCPSDPVRVNDLHQLLVIKSLHLQIHDNDENRT